MDNHIIFVFKSGFSLYQPIQKVLSPSKCLNMSVTVHFVWLDWIACGKNFDLLAIPTNVIASFDAEMQIPLNPFSEILDTSTPTANILSTETLPQIQPNITPDNPCLSHIFFSAPTPLSKIWFLLPIPALSLGSALASTVGQAWVDGNKSVIHWLN